MNHVRKYRRNPSEVVKWTLGLLAGGVVVGGGIYLYEKNKSSNSNPAGYDINGWAPAATSSVPGPGSSVNFFAQLAAAMKNPASASASPVGWLPYSSTVGPQQPPAAAGAGPVYGPFASSATKDSNGNWVTSAPYYCFVGSDPTGQSGQWYFHN